MNWSRFAARCVVILLGLQAASVAQGADGAWSVEFLNSRKGEWDQLSGATIRVEGRVSLAGGGQFKLAKCDLSFHTEAGQMRSLQGKKSVEVTGRIKKEENGKLFFSVDRIQILPTDLEQYGTRTARLRNARAAEWYEVGDWAAERSQFYDDAELAKKALQAYEHGVMAEWRGLAADDADGRFQLVAKVTKFKLPDSRRMELIHEANRILWAAAVKNPPADKGAWTELTARLAEGLPGSTQPLERLPADMVGRYEKEPLALYHESPLEVRQQLHRIFYSTVLLKMIEGEAARDGKNGDVIAARLDELVPEAHSLAEQYRTRHLNWRLEQAVHATRPEIEQLAADFRARQQPDLARQAVTRWLQEREPRMRQDGALGLMQLADEYLSLARDERKAVTLLAEAHKLDPAFTDVSEKLKQLGYVDVSGTWIKSNPDNTPAPNGLAEVPVPGAVVVGMSAVAARNVMGFRPGTLGRALTKSGVSEVWTYGPPGTSRLIIRLESTTVNPELRVTAINNER